MKWQWSALPVALVLAACTSSPFSTAGGATAGGLAQEAASEPSQLRLLIQRGSMGVEVDDVSAAVASIEALAAELDAFIESRTRYTDESANLVLRIPADRLDEAVARLGELGEETHRRLEARDVTDEVGDKDARRQNLVALRDRLRTLLRRAKSVDDVLAVERELTRVQTELDSLEGRLTRLRNDVARAQLEVQIRKKEPKQVLGPLGLAWRGLAWFVEKLFVIRHGAP